MDNLIFQQPIFAWAVFLGFMALCACLMFAVLDIEITRKGKMPEDEPEPDFPTARIKDAPYNIIMAAADHKRQEGR